jgi:hypothetical protein
MPKARPINDKRARRLRSLAKALRPGVVPLRKLIAAGDFLPEPAQLAFRELKLNPNHETDWRVLAALLAIYIFDEGKSPGAHPWSTIQQTELLAEVHSRRQTGAAPLNDEEVCWRIARDKNSPGYFRRSPRTVGSKGYGLVKQLRKARQQASSLARAAFPLAF